MKKLTIAGFAALLGASAGASRHGRGTKTTNG